MSWWNQLSRPRKNCLYVETQRTGVLLGTGSEPALELPQSNTHVCSSASCCWLVLGRSWSESLCVHAAVWFLSVGDCLLDQPQKQLSLPDNLPGSSYSLHRQCELAFGSGSKPCPYMQPCSKLWCTGKARGQLVCQTRHFPWADGTSCNNGKVCYRGACAEKNSTMHIKVTHGRKNNTFVINVSTVWCTNVPVFSSVPGGWQMGEVGGIRRLFPKLWWRCPACQESVWQPRPWEWRQILLRPPHQVSLVQPELLSWNRYSNNITDCFCTFQPGRHKLSTCESGWCSMMSKVIKLYFCTLGKSFREEQCVAFNGLNLNTNRLGASVVWVPKYSGISPKDKCKLICRANGTGYFYVLAPKVCCYIWSIQADWTGFKQLWSFLISEDKWKQWNTPVRLAGLHCGGDVLIK